VLAPEVRSCGSAILRDSPVLKYLIGPVAIQRERSNVDDRSGA
jgi:hypothetical protein